MRGGESSSACPSSIEDNLVPEARLELASLAAEDFESPASTIPPLGPPGAGLGKTGPLVNVGRTSKIVGLERVAVSQLAGLQTRHEPARTLLRGTVGEGMRHRALAGLSLIHI